MHGKRCQNMTTGQVREMEEIRLVLPFPSIFYATIYLAESQGFLADVGLRSRIAYAERGGDPVEGLMTGAGEVAVGGIVRLMRMPKDESNKFAIIGQVNGASGFSICAAGPHRSNGPICEHGSSFPSRGRVRPGFSRGPCFLAMASIRNGSI